MCLEGPSPFANRPPQQSREVGLELAIAAETAAREAHYSVVDVETTGLDPRAHRILECAIVELDSHGGVTAEWSSLVRVPGEGDLGASHVHGITRTMLVDAPVFAEIVPEIVARLAGRVVVGHVLHFDLAHLGAEFSRCGVLLPDLSATGLCTRELARSHLPPGRRSLAHCCTAAGVDITDAHTALGDARAAAGLLRYFIASGCAHTWEVRCASAQTARWPAVASLGPEAPTVALARDARR